MSEGLVVNVRRALRQQLLTVDSLPSTQQWDGIIDFTPPSDGTPWLRETMLRQPGPPARKSIGTQARIRHTGGYNIDLFFAPDTDSDVHDIEACAEDIRAAFPFSLQLNYGGQLVTCEGCGISTVERDLRLSFPMLRCSARIAWWADTFNPI